MLAELETIRRAGERITVADFLRRVGYVYKQGKRKGQPNRQAIQRYGRLRSALNGYCVQGSGRPHLAGTAEATIALQAAERAGADAAAERDRLSGEVAALRAALAAAEGARAADGVAHAALTREAQRLRGLASAMASYATQRSAVHAPDLMQTLREAAAGLGVPVPEWLIPGGPASGGPASDEPARAPEARADAPPALTVSRGGAPTGDAPAARTRHPRAPERRPDAPSDG